MNNLPREPKKPLFVGDTHGDLGWWIKKVIPIAKRSGCDAILQLGDFGIWPGEGGQKYLNRLNEELEKAGMWTLFVDGNHEDFDQLLAIPVREDGYREVRERIIHAPRGKRWEWYGLKWMAMGGAVSIDKADRTLGASWWPQEAITYAQVKQAMEGGKVDVLLTHDCPTMVHFKGMFMYPMADENRRLLQELIDVVKPEILLHGHMHHGYSTIVERDDREISVVGLNCNKESGSIVRMEPDKLKAGIPFEATLSGIGGSPKIRVREQSGLE